MADSPLHPLRTTSASPPQKRQARCAMLAAAGALLATVLGAAAPPREAHAALVPPLSGEPQPSSLNDRGAGIHSA